MDDQPGRGARAGFARTQAPSRTVESSNEGTQTATVCRTAEPDLSELQAHYEESYATLYKIAAGMVGASEAADIVQEAYADTAARIRGGLELENLGGWLYTVVKNLCLKRLRSPKLAPLKEDAEIVNSCTPAELAEMKARCAAIRTAIEDLPGHQRPAFILAELRGMRYVEIAETLELSTDSVRQHLFRARERVRRAVGEESFALLPLLLRLDEASRQPPCPDRGLLQALLDRASVRLAEVRMPALGLSRRLAGVMPHIGQAVVGSVMAAVVVTAGADTIAGNKQAEQQPGGGTTVPAQVQQPAAGTPSSQSSNSQQANPGSQTVSSPSSAPGSQSGGDSSEQTGGEGGGGGNGTGGGTQDKRGCSSKAGSSRAASCQQTPVADQTPAQPASAPSQSGTPADGGGAGSSPDTGGGDDGALPPSDPGPWSSPVDVSAPLGAADIQPDVAVSSNGAAVAVWNTGGGTVQASYRNAGADSSWSAPVDLSTAGRNADSARVAIDDEGDAVAVWRQYNGSKYVIEGATRVLYIGGGAWSSEAGLSDGSQNAGSPDLALSPSSGDGIITWIRSNGSNNIVQATDVHANGDWGVPSDLSAPGQNATDPAVGINDARDVVVVWTRWDGVTGYVVQAARKFGGGLWQAPSNVSTPGGDPPAGAGRPQVGVYDAGDVVVVWQNADQPKSAKAATQHGGDPWTAPQTISSTDNSGMPNVELAVDKAGNAVAVWSGGAAYPFSILAASRPAGGSWSDPSTIASPGSSGIKPDVAIGADGTVVAVWQYAYPNASIDAATLGFGGAWSEPTTIASGSNGLVYPKIGVDGNGSAVTTWMNGSTQTVQSARYATN